jgi:hypothetical protein
MRFSRTSPDADSPAKGSARSVIGTSIATRLAGDQSVNADKTSADVDERSAAAARIDRRVRLHVDHRRLRPQLAGDGADDPEGDRVVQTERAAEGEHELSGAQFVGVAEGQRRQVARVDFDHREIGLEIESDDLGIEAASARAQDRAAVGGERQLHADALRAAHDVRIGDDVAIGIDDHAGSGCPLRRNQIAAARDDRIARGVGRREDFDDRRCDEAGSGRQRPAQVRVRRGGSGNGLAGRRRDRARNAGKGDDNRDDRLSVSGCH